MKLRCSQCDYIGERTEFWKPSDICYSYNKCPKCGQRQCDFYVYKEPPKTLDEFVEWLESKGHDTWMTRKLLNKWIPIYQSSGGKTK